MGGKYWGTAVHIQKEINGTRKTTINQITFVSQVGVPCFTGVPLHPRRAVELYITVAKNPSITCMPLQEHRQATTPPMHDQYQQKPHHFAGAFGYCTTTSGATQPPPHPSRDSRAWPTAVPTLLLHFPSPTRNRHQRNKPSPHLCTQKPQSRYSVSLGTHAGGVTATRQLPGRRALLRLSRQRQGMCPGNRSRRSPYHAR